MNKKIVKLNKDLDTLINLYLNLDHDDLEDSLGLTVSLTVKRIEERSKSSSPRKLIVQEWEELLRRNKKQAIKLYKRRTGSSSALSKEVIENFMERRWGKRSFKDLVGVDLNLSKDDYE